MEAVHLEKGTSGPEDLAFHLAIYDASHNPLFRQLLEQQRPKLRQREEEFIEWVIKTPPIRLSGAAAIFTAATTGIPLGLTHHLKHNRVLHERVLLIASVSVDEPRVEDADRIKLVPVGAGKGLRGHEIAGGVVGVRNEQLSKFLESAIDVALIGVFHR